MRTAEGGAERTGSQGDTNDWLEPEEIIAGNAKLLTWYGIGSIIGPFLASLIMRAVGPDGLSNEEGRH